MDGALSQALSPPRVVLGIQVLDPPWPVPVEMDHHLNLGIAEHGVAGGRDGHASHRKSPGGGGIELLPYPGRLPSGSNPQNRYTFDMIA